MRCLTNEYQYIPLRIMHHFALGQHGGGHEPMDLASFEETKFAAYQVPAALKGLAQHLEEQAACLGRTPVARDDARYPHGTPPPAATCRTLEETKWLRNHYLHRSAQTLARDQGIGMAARVERMRLIIPDDDPHFVPPSLADAKPRPPAVPAW